MESPGDFLSGASKRELEVYEKLLRIRDVRIGFATEHHINTRGEKMDFIHYPHIRDLYESLAREIVLQGSVQSFKSEWAVIDQFAMAFVGLSVFYVLPKFEMRTTYVQNRINRCVQNVGEYKRIIGEGFFDSVAIKSFGKGVVKYVGANVLADFKEFPADALVIDEVDQCDKSNLEYALDRLRASKYQFKRYLGNPKNQGEGISALFLLSDQREWTVPCKSCGEYHELDWFNTVVKDICDRDGNVVSYILLDKDWEPGCKRDIKIICPSCGGELERESTVGKWLVKNPESSVEGYHISMLCSPINSVAEMWSKFQNAIHDPMLMQAFFNSYLGLAYAAAGNKVTSDLLDRNAELGYNLVIDGDVAFIEGDGHPGPCSMGVDVGNVFDVRVSAQEGKKRRLVFVGKVRSLDDLYDIVERYNVESCVIDSMPETMVVQDFQETAKCEVWLCRYRGEGVDRRRVYDSRYRIINVDRTEALDKAFAALRRERNILPLNYPSLLNGEYVSEMCGPVRQVVEDTRGNKKYEWTKCKDHQRHADAYDLLAFEILQEAEIIDVAVG